MTYVLYLDRYHLGDPLFLTGFARDVLTLGAPCLLVHGAGEAAERALEAQGRFPKVEGGVLSVETEEDRRVVARAARELNRQIVHTLNEAGVAAVGMEASGRGLLRRSETGIVAGKMDWLRDLIIQGAVAVVAAILTDAEGGVREANGGAVAGSLARALAEAEGAATAIFLTKNGQNGFYSQDMQLEEVGAEAVLTGVLPEPDAVLAASEAGADVLVTGRSGLRSEPLKGTAIRPVGSKKTP